MNSLLLFWHGFPARHAGILAQMLGPGKCLNPRPWLPWKLSNFDAFTSQLIWVENVDISNTCKEYVVSIIGLYKNNCAVSWVWNLFSYATLTFHGPWVYSDIELNTIISWAIMYSNCNIFLLLEGFQMRGQMHTECCPGNIKPWYCISWKISTCAYIQNQHRHMRLFSSRRLFFNRLTPMECKSHMHLFLMGAYYWVLAYFPRNTTTYSFYITGITYYTLCTWYRNFFFSSCSYPGSMANKKYQEGCPGGPGPVLKG